EAFSSTWEKDQERYLEVLVDEFAVLERFTQDQTPLVQEAIAQLVLDQEAVAREELAKLFGDEEAFAELSLAYQAAMEDQLAVFFDKHLEEHVAVADSIVRRLETIAASEPDKVEDTQVLIGMLVELLGLHRQSAGQELAHEVADYPSSSYPKLPFLPCAIRTPLHTSSTSPKIAPPNRPRWSISSAKKALPSKGMPSRPIGSVSFSP